MRLRFKQDNFDSDMWHEYLVVTSKMSIEREWHKGTMHEDVVNEMLDQLGLEERTYNITDPDTVNCDCFYIEITNGNVSINY